MKLFYFYSFFFLLFLLELLTSFVVDPNFYKIGNQYIPDKALIYRHKPLYEGVWVINGHTEVVRINSLGFRGAEPDKNKENIIILGDSMVYGHGVSNEESFSFLLQKKVEKNVFNAGVKGFGSDQSLILLREIIEKQKVKMIIFSFNFNDIYDNVVKKRLEGDGLMPVKKETHFAAAFAWFYESLFPVLPSRLIQYIFTKGLFWYSQNYTLKNMDFDIEKEKIVETLRVVNRIANEQGVKCMFLVMPNVSRSLNEFDFLRGKGLDDQLIMPNFDNQRFFIDSDIHFSPIGHQEMANVLFEALVNYDVFSN